MCATIEIINSQNTNMQDKNNNPQPSSDPAAAANTAVSQAAQGDFIKKVVDKIKSSENILVVLSRSPSIDEIAAALGLTMFLDGMQKHTTAVYSGRIPDSLAFLQPAETFETNTDSLQDFIIALDKDKADHLRYKLEGDFVKIFITPYKTIITSDDLVFSRGDFNVDFVIAINVSSSNNLDYALKEHGRIMRDASVVNITAGEPGRFGEIEWSNPVASSLCEMITNLVFAIQDPDEKELDHDVATTLLAGIVAATERFSNDRTNPDTLGIASKLMSMGADQQLITSNISTNEIIHNEENYSYGPQPNAEKPAEVNHSNLTIDHEEPNTPPVNPYANPAAQMAPNLNMSANPNPTAMIDGTNNVTPESVIVQPIIPGAAPQPANAAPTNPAQMQIPSPVNPSQMQIPNPTPVPPVATPNPTPVPTPAAPASTAPNPAQMQIPNLPSTPTAPAPDPTQMQLPNTPAPESTHSLITGVPTPPAAKQVGPNLTPPAHTPKPQKNYAEMMEAALSGESAPPSTPDTPNPAAPQSPVNPMEPVANPADAPVLPPPPAPGTDVNNIMPPVLPPVQMPPQA